ncbi:MAG: AI-2E family transporter [Candidatus Latescibacteria bacterium]|nr:AI-2E family transporter [Candidatus Latescibacterota bacterium]
MTDWRKKIREPRIWVLLTLGVFSLVVLVWFFGALVPFFAAGVVGYLLDPLVVRLERWRIPRLLAIVLVMLGTLLLVALIIFSIVPTVVEQLNSLANQIPGVITKVEIWIGEMQYKYPQYFPGTTAFEFFDSLSLQIENLLGGLITVLLAWAGGTIGGTVNAVIVAFLVFFILKDKDHIWDYIVKLLPGLRHATMREVLADIDRQMGRFIKGKFIVVFLLFFLSTAVFWVIGLKYFLLLGILTGLSTFIPYVGAIVVGFPVVAAGFIQWGTWSAAVGTLAAYLGVQSVDGYYLTPVIIGKETSIHPIAIIMAILICGSLWGFWGVFFAVPAAVIVKSILDQVYFPSLEKAASEEEAIEETEKALVG